MNDTITPRLLTVFQAAKYLAISERKLWSLTKEDRISVVKIGRCVRYDLADLDTFIAAAKGQRQ
jgi:excisionase family DNA binding protein